MSVGVSDPLVEEFVRGWQVLVDVKICHIHNLVDHAFVQSFLKKMMTLLMAGQKLSFESRESRVIHFTVGGMEL
jgi:hypothetical protein